MARPLNSRLAQQEGTAFCPCCKKLRNPSSLQKTLSLDYYGWSGLGKLGMATLQNEPCQFACDICLQNGSALVANPLVQTYVDYLPIFAYFDRQKRCQTCKTSFVFSAAEQKQWYGEMKCWVQSTQADCEECRKTKPKPKANNKELNALLSENEDISLSGWEQVAALYTEMGAWDKMKGVYGQIRKARQALEQAAGSDKKAKENNS